LNIINIREKKMKSKILKRLEIVFLDFDDIKNPLLGAGQARATFEVASRLIKNCHKVTVISSRYPGFIDRYEQGIYYKHIGLGSNNIKLNNLAYIIALPFAVMKLKGDIIIECFTAPISTLFSPLFTKIPVIALPTSFDAKRFSKLYHLPFWLVEKFGCRFYKYFIALTPYLADKMKRYNQNTIIQIIPQGVSENYFRISNKKPEHILFMGRLDINQKGLDLLLYSYSKVAKAIPFPLIIAGSGPDKEKVKELIKKLGLEKCVRLTGFADNKMKLDLLSKTAFVAFPSRNEGFSLVSLEAIASGHRLVSFDLPSLRWAKTNVARKVNQFDVRLYSQALLLEAKQSENISAEKVCRNYVKKYSWDNVTGQFEQFINNVLKKDSLI
jgi:glycosyltransferase involved in cell wall biosynthesis